MTRGRKPTVHDLDSYCCPKCKQHPVEKSKYKNMCVTCYRAYCNKRAKAYYARMKGTPVNDRPGRQAKVETWDTSRNNDWLRLSFTGSAPAPRG